MTPRADQIALPHPDADELPQYFRFYGWRPSELGWTCEVRSQRPFRAPFGRHVTVSLWEAAKMTPDEIVRVAWMRITDAVAELQLFEAHEVKPLERKVFG